MSLSGSKTFIWDRPISGPRSFPDVIGEPTLPSVRVLIADDHILFRDGLCAVLNATSRFRVVGTADGANAARIAAAHRPDIVLMDWGLSQREGKRLLREFAVSGLSVRTILLNCPAEPTDVAEVVRLGVKGILSDDATSESLGNTIYQVIKGEYALGQAGIASLVAKAADRRPRNKLQIARQKFGITHREYEILCEVVAGYSTSEISEKLNISCNTIKHHITHIFDKLGVSNRLELALFATNHKLLPDD